MRRDGPPRWLPILGAVLALGTIAAMLLPWHVSPRTCVIETGIPIERGPCLTAEHCFAVPDGIDDTVYDHTGPLGVTLLAGLCLTFGAIALLDGPRAWRRGGLLGVALVTAAGMQLSATTYRPHPLRQAELGNGCWISIAAGATLLACSILIAARARRFPPPVVPPATVVG